MDFEGLSFRQIDADTIIKSFDCGDADLNDFLFATMRRSACRFITVDAYAAAVPFYEKCGFMFLSEKDLNAPTRAMYFDLINFPD